MKIIDLSNRDNMFYWQTNRLLTAEETKRIFLERYEALSEDLIGKIINYGMKSAGYKGKDTQIEKVEGIIKRGSVNSVIPVRLKSGKKVVLRIHPKNVKNGYFWVEKTATDLAKKLGVPTYKTTFIDDSQKVIPHDFMIMSAVKGKPMQDVDFSNKDLEKKLVTETGRYAALIHQVKPKGFGFFLNQLAKEKKGLQGQYKLFKDHIFAALYIDLRYLVDNGVLNKNQNKTIESLFNKSDDLMKCKQGSLIHNDIADWNELSDGKSVTGIMDWDECFCGDRLMEVAAYSLFYGEPRLTWFKEGYSEVNKLEKNEDKFQLFKLRYLISKMHLRKKRSTIDPSPTMKQNIVRGIQAMEEVFDYFGF